MEVVGVVEVGGGGGGGWGWWRWVGVVEVGGGGGGGWGWRTHADGMGLLKPCPFIQWVVLIVWSRYTNNYMYIITEGGGRGRRYICICTLVFHGILFKTENYLEA